MKLKRFDLVEEKFSNSNHQGACVDLKMILDRYPEAEDERILSMLSEVFDRLKLSWKHTPNYKGN
jgi:hypothetical protein